MDAINFNFVCNNVKGSQTSRKRLKWFKYFKIKIFPNGIIFLQETHSTKDNEINWKDEFHGDLCFSRGKSNSCGILTGFSDNKPFTVKKHLCDKNGRILILETLTDDSEFILINFYNVNTVSEQIQTLNEQNTLLSNLEKHNFCWWL